MVMTMIMRMNMDMNKLLIIINFFIIFHRCRTFSLPADIPFTKAHEEIGEVEPIIFKQPIFCLFMRRTFIISVKASAIDFVEKMGSGSA